MEAFCLPGAETARNEDFDQFWTPAPVAKWFVDWCRLEPGMRVFEAGAGAGNLVRAVGPGIALTSYEIDPRFEYQLWCARQHDRHDHEVRIENFLLADVQEADVGYSNPPYSKPFKGIDTAFVLKMLRHVRQRASLLVSAGFLYGTTRYEQIWSKYTLLRQTNFVYRPEFTEFVDATGPKTNYVALDIAPYLIPGYRPQYEWTVVHG